uniref:Uncharacterized protein n=1 Tax=Romanomermis culicivorax TaxID=13658 RepID=A0A915K946_ROMCU
MNRETKLADNCFVLRRFRKANILFDHGKKVNILIPGSKSRNQNYENCETCPMEISQNKAEKSIGNL